MASVLLSKLTTLLIRHPKPFELIDVLNCHLSQIEYFQHSKEPRHPGAMCENESATRLANQPTKCYAIGAIRMPFIVSITFGCIQAQITINNRKSDRFYDRIK